MLNDLDILVVEHKKTFGVYGIDRMKHHLVKKYNINWNHKKISRYKSIFNIETKSRRKSKLFTRNMKKRKQKYMAPNLLNCNFTSTISWQKLSTDVSYIKCTNGLLYLSAVKDLFNNEIVSYSISENNDTNLIIESFSNVKPFKGVVHSDQGAQYYSYRYIEMLNEKGYSRSMSRRGACWENSPIENWFSQLKSEWLRPKGLMNKEETIMEIGKYIQWYNNERIQKGLNYMSPTEFLSTI